MRVLDDCGRKVELPARPRRIVSLCPSLTETLYTLLPAERIVGRTDYCLHPQGLVADAASVGGTKRLKRERVAALTPDLIVAEKEENTREDVAALAEDWPVYVLDVLGLGSAIAAVRRLGELGGAAESGWRLADAIGQRWAALPRVGRPLRVLYLIWRKPWMAVGRDTYIDAVLTRLGLVNVAAGLAGRYPAIATEDLAALGADLCLLSSEPFPFRDRHVAELAPWLPGAQLEHVDGEMFSWYGARMLPAAGYLEACVQRWETNF